jgi:arylsulfatase A-like enzyme
MIRSLTRRILVACLLGIVSLLALSNRPLLADDRPDIVLMMSDDHGWDEVGYYDHPHLHTPVLDEMARVGLRFDRFYSAHPSCSPTRGSVITGRHPVRYGTFAPNWSLRPEEISIAQILAEAGYACGHFGKWHLGPVKADSPTNPGAMGFHEWLSHDNFFEMDPVLSRNGGPPEEYPGEGSEVIVAQATRFIEQAKQDGKPVFVLICFGSPHEPYSGLEEDLALYDDLPAGYAERTVRLTSNETGLATERPLNEVLQERYAEITAMDRAIGQLRDWLAGKEMRENTLFWYFSDNGSPAEGAVTLPLRGRKAQMWEGGIRVPAVLEWPKRIPEPRVSDVNAVTSDLLPTLCDLLGLPVPDRPLDGISLKPVIDGEMTERPHPIGFWHFNTRQLMERNPKPYIDPELQRGTTPLVKKMGDVFTRNFTNVHVTEITDRDFEGARAWLDNRYKLIIAQRGGESGKELYDLREDPAEANNLIESKPEIARELEQQLRAWQKSVLHSLTGTDYD